MRDHPTSGEPGSDIRRLRAAHPLWAFGTVWAGRASGPDARRLVATRMGVQVHAWTEAELSARIGDAERLNGWAS
jgi:hypothetical protein